MTYWLQRLESWHIFARCARRSTLIPHCWLYQLALTIIKNLILNSSIHAGIRAPLVRRKGDMKNDRRCGFETIKAPDLDTLGVKGVVDLIRQRVKRTRVYVSIDIDVLDPAYAPG